MYLYKSGDVCSSITGGWNPPANDENWYTISGWQTSPYLCWRHRDDDDVYSKDWCYTTRAINVSPYTKLCADITVSVNSGNRNAVNLVLLDTDTSDVGIGSIAEDTSTRSTIVWNISSYTGSYKIGVSSWLGPGDDFSVYVHQIWLE